ncbi:enoyl-CoA hydratase/isomerase family protein [Neopusillimonas aromaticivorans]|uniref:enoyl-CoA hydratase/isomerase family protein n=1 Tax=Neopusillimonas aromaticivorans TaxID=2979868 RepID=UPI0025953E81|nr:enoyl-CoA hydratase/isomerase family protein [Neopusillimonas aromaticivorans]WJJ94903.1 enoyl-CoA hydratase/isomerase family protein [Neopusillimonas aromaticivorans]
MSSLLVEDRNHVRILTLNRPGQHNAMDIELYERLTAALVEAEKDDSVRAVVINGNGPSFCSGADTKEFEQLTPDQEKLVEYRASLTYNLHKTIPEMEKPVVAAVHGFAVGGGCGLALACDITLADAEARLGYPEIRHGLVAAVVMANLTKQVGRKAAFELVSLGKVVDAEEAHRIGMISRVVSAGTVFEAALEVAEKLAERVPSALRATKRLFQAVADIPLSEGLVLGKQANEAMRAYRVDALKNYAQAVAATGKA